MRTTTTARNRNSSAKANSTNRSLPFPPASSALFSFFPPPAQHFSRQYSTFPKIETIETFWNTRDVLSTALITMKETLRWQFFSSSARVARKTTVSAFWFSQRFTFQYYWHIHASRF
jgi:hypothetical protein